jgi:hypothetical protein
VGTINKYFWNIPTETVGRRYGAVVSDSSIVPARYWTGTFANYMSYFVQGENPLSSLDILRAETYPPQSDWETISSGTAGYESPQLALMPEDFQVPFVMHQLSSVNSTAATLLFTTGAGSFAQPINTNWDGSVEFDTVREIAPQGTILLNSIKLPRRVCAVIWNENAGRMEMLRSQDEFGIIWEDFDVVGSDRIVDTRRPEGPVFTESSINIPHITFRDSATGQIVMRELTANWVDNSPPLQFGFAPKVSQIMSGELLPGQSVHYISEDRTQILQIVENFEGDWLNSWVIPAAEAPDGLQISDYDIYTAPQPGYENYIVYTSGGQLYMAYCENSSLETWYDPVVIDPGPNCASPRIHIVGSDSEFQVKFMVNYLSVDDLGVTRVNFRDLREARMQLLGF